MLVEWYLWRPSSLSRASADTLPGVCSCLCANPGREQLLLSPVQQATGLAALAGHEMACIRVP